MHTLFVGVDVGATKIHVRAEDAAGLVADRVVSNDGWRSLDLAGRARAIVALVGEAIPTGSGVGSLAVGAHGCDSSAQCLELRAAIGDCLPVRCEVVNDAELIVLAHGDERGIGVVSGTGSIAVGRVDGVLVRAGGRGWLLGDDGGAAGLVRAAARVLLQRADEGPVSDVLGEHLAAALGAPGLEDIAATMTTTAPEQWAQAAPAIFTAANAGSALARAVIDAGGEALARLVWAVGRQGVRDTLVVAAGGVIANQPAMATAFVEHLRRRRPDAEVHVLHEPPVAGAVVLARRLVATGSGASGPGLGQGEPGRRAPM